MFTAVKTDHPRERENRPRGYLVTQQASCGGASLPWWGVRLAPCAVGSPALGLSSAARGRVVIPADGCARSLAPTGV